MIEILVEAMNGDDHPVCVAAVSLLNRRIRVPNDGF